MKLGLLIVGTEVLKGLVADANTFWLAGHLKSLNLELSKTITVGDGEAEIIKGLQELYEQCDFVFTSGGLGPTLDDITKTSIASFFNLEVKHSAEARLVAEKNYKQFNRELVNGHIYETLPVGFSPLWNPSGFAPAFYYQTAKNKFILSAPGVPKEFKSIITEHFQKIISPFLTNKDFAETITFRTKRIPEEKIFSELCPTLWQDLEAFGNVSSLPQLMSVDVCAHLKAKSREELEDKKNKVIQLVTTSALHSYIWEIGTRSIEEVILDLSKKKNLHFGFAESCTGGLCSHRMTNIAGASSAFWGSVVCYDNSVKENILGVKKQTLQEFGAVSEQTASEMAIGLKTKLNLDLAVAITGIAGPGGGSEEKPVGTVCLGLADKAGVSTYKLVLFGDREQLKNRFAQAALMILLEKLQSN
ncbi:MAG: nicotinamide-nucleotide amidohydrolase family protein [Bacteriovoracaceae bacterium]